MKVFEPNCRHLREVLIFCFNLKKTAAETHRMLLSIFGDAKVVFEVGAAFAHT